jgi:hypothetical protein
MANSSSVARGRRDAPKSAEKLVDSNVLGLYPARRRAVSHVDRAVPSTAGTEVAGSVSGSDRPIALIEPKQVPTIRYSQQAQMPFSIRHPHIRKARKQSLQNVARWSSYSTSVMLSSLDGWLLLAAIGFVLAILVGGVGTQHISAPIQIAPRP